MCEMKGSNKTNKNGCYFSIMHNNCSQFDVVLGVRAALDRHYIVIPISTSICSESFSSLLLRGPRKLLHEILKYNTCFIIYEVKTLDLKLFVNNF